MDLIEAILICLKSGRGVTRTLSTGKEIIEPAVENIEWIEREYKNGTLTEPILWEHFFPEVI